MATGIRDKVAIIGMGCTRFGERWDVGAEELMVEAFEECLTDAGIEKKEIEAAWFGSCLDEINVGKSALPLSTTLRLPMIRPRRFFFPFGRSRGGLTMSLEGGFEEVEESFRADASCFSSQPS